MYSDSMYQTVIWNSGEEGTECVQIRYPISGTEEDEEIVGDIKRIMEGLLMEILMHMDGERGSDGDA